MNGHLAEAFQREAKLFCKESSVWILLSVYGLFLAYGSLQGIVSYRGELEKIARIRGEYSTRWTDIKRKAETAASGPTGAETKEVWGSWRSASLSGSAEGGAVAWITPSTLGALTRGHASREESIRRVSLYENPVRPPLANPINVMYGWMDFGFVVLWLLPVVLMLLAFQAVGRDRELGVWPIVLASGISPRYLILVRLLAPTLMTLGLTFASAALIVVLTSNAFGLAFPLWVLTVTLYGAFWVMLAAWAGLSAKSPVRQQLILGGIWMGAAWIAPGLLEAVMELRIPPVSAIDGVLAAREAQIGVAQRVGPLMHRVYEQNPEWLPASELVTRMNQPVPGGPRRRDARNVYATYLVGEEATAKNKEELANRRREMEVLANRFSSLSPMLCVQYLSEELAGSSPGRYQWFNLQADSFIRKWREYFAGKVWRLEEMEAADIPRLPSFLETDEPTASTLNRAAWPAAGLFLWLMISAALLHRGLNQIAAH